MPKKTTGGRASIPAGTAVSGRSTADSSGINGPLAECDPLVPRRQMLKRKRTELEESLQEQHSEKEVCPLPLVFPSGSALLMPAQPDRGQSTLSTHGIAHPDPILRGLEFDVPELTEAMLQSISQLQAAGQLECVTIRLHRVTPTLKLLCNLASPLSLDLSHTDMTDEDLKGLQGIPNLVKLDLSFCRGVTDLSPILHIQTLEVVALSGCLQLVGVGTLSRLPRLKELDLSETTVTDEEVRLLSQSHTLVKVDLHSCKKLKNVNALSSIATLEVINLSRCIFLAHVGALGKLPALKEVNLSGTPIKDEEVRLLSECHVLVKVDLSWCKALTNVDPLSSIAALEVLNLAYCTSLTHMGDLGKLPVLKEVFLDETCFTDKEIRKLSKCHTLVKIDLHSCDKLKNVNALSSIATLEEINLSSCYSLTHVGALGKLPALKEVNLSGTPIKDEEVRLLSECHVLVKIDLSWCKALKNVNPLSSIATLEVIDLSRCESLTHVGALAKLPALKEVDLSFTPITDKEVRQLGESHTLVKIDLHSCDKLKNVNPLSSIATLEVINLSWCDSLTRVGALGKLPALKEVDLSRTHITDEDVRHLGQSKTLVKIDLHCCEKLKNVNPLSSIATLEVIILSECTSLTHMDVGALGKLPALKEVNLSKIPITDEDVRHLGQSHTLMKIDLHSCEKLKNVNPLSSIATLEVIILSECTSLTHMDVGALGKLPALKEVNLSKIPITDEDVRHLGQSHTLVKIDLHCCEKLKNVNPLSSIATLEVIDLSGCTSLTCVGELGKLPVLKEVDLIGTSITDKEVRLLGQGRTLVKINLSLCKALTNVNPLSSIATLEEIHLNGCASLVHVGELRRLPLLKELDLTNTRITDEEVRLLGECQSLVKIDLNSCDALTNANPLSSIETLEEINLASCTSLKRLSALSKLPKLTSMCLQRTHLRDEELDTLTSLREEWGLPSVYIRRGYITAEGCFFQ